MLLKSTMSKQDLVAAGDKRKSYLGLAMLGSLAARARSGAAAPGGALFISVNRSPPESDQKKGYLLEI